MEEPKSACDVHLASTVLCTMSKGRAGKRHITMLLNGLRVNTLSQALKISSVLGGSAIRKRGGKEGFWGGRDGLAPSVGWGEGSWPLCLETTAGGQSLNWSLLAGRGHVLPPSSPQDWIKVGPLCSVL